jgi:DNA-binding CsgD family transcriptional regulator/tetratricopeptide (TPR) repeat protein
VTLTERERELDLVAGRVQGARTGTGGAVMVCGESGAGKTSFVEAFTTVSGGGMRVLWGVCDPLSTPRPLGPLHDLASEFSPATRQLLTTGEQPVDIFAAVFADLCLRPTILVLDDLHWADQGTIDLLRFLLRRAPQTHLLAVGTARDDELGVSHPLRSLLGDVARSPHSTTITLNPLSLEAISALVGDRDVDPVRLHRITGSNPFFVAEMLDHRGDDLPTTVRDAILARTVDLDAAAWDVLHLLTCATGAIADHLLAGLGVTADALHALDAARLIRRDTRGLAFRHDLCRRAVAAVMPPGVEPGLHRRFIAAHRAAGDTDPAVLVHHAAGAGDRDLITTAGVQAGRRAATSGAHTQAVEFFELALQHGGVLSADTEAELLEQLAEEYYLVDRLDDAVAACRRALRIRQDTRDPVAIAANHHSLAIYEWYNGHRDTADHHLLTAVDLLRGDSHTAAAQGVLGHVFATQAFLALQSSHLDRTADIITAARDIALRTGDPDLTVRVEVVERLRDLLCGREDARADMLTLLSAGLGEIDETYSTGYTNLSYFDVEQRRLDAASELLEMCLPLMVEHDLPICHVVQMGSRSRLHLLTGDWDEALADADVVLERPSAPLARTWPLLIRALVALRRDGDDGGNIDAAWELAGHLGELVRILPVAAAIVERAWLTGADDTRLDRCRALLVEATGPGLDWARGELAVWLHRLDGSVADCAVAPPYRDLLTGQCTRAAEAFDALGAPYDAALALIDSGDPDAARGAVDVLDRLGAAAVAARVRLDLRSRGLRTVPAPRWATTLTNPAGLTARQVEVLRLIDEGLTSVEMAQRLFLSVKTVDHHVAAIMTKLDVPRRRDAVRRARELGILT